MEIIHGAQERRNYDINLVDWIQNEGKNEGNIVIKNFKTKE